MFLRTNLLSIRFFMHHFLYISALITFRFFKQSAAGCAHATKSTHITVIKVCTFDELADYGNNSSCWLDASHSAGRVLHIFRLFFIIDRKT